LKKTKLNVLVKRKTKLNLFKRLEVEMANKLVPVDIARIRPRFDGKSPHWLGMGMGMGNPRLFTTGYEDSYGDIHILAIILVPAISLSSFKLLKYSQLIK